MKWGGLVAKLFDLKKFYILLALRQGPLHGYDIHQQVLADSLGSLYFSFTSLYCLMKQLEQAGLIEKLEGPGLSYMPYELTARDGFV